MYFYRSKNTAETSGGPHSFLLRRGTNWTDIDILEACLLCSEPENWTWKTSCSFNFFKKNGDATNEL